MIITKSKYQMLTVLSDGSSIKTSNSININKLKFMEKDFKQNQFNYKKNAINNINSKHNKFTYRKKLFT